MPQIDYAVRPAKNVERKMIAEALARLSKLQSPDEFRYVGLGALYFRDFSLFHKVLGIHDMYSIEHNTSEQARYLFNRPFKCVKMCFGESTDELPKIPLNEKLNVVWLDYESMITSDILTDISRVCSEALAGSVLIVTLNAEARSIGIREESGEAGEAADDLESAALSPKPKKRDPLEQLKEQLPGKIPVETRKSDLAGWGTADLFRKIVENQIAQTLKDRNGILGPEDVLAYEPFFDFRYADGARMLTTGGILRAHKQKDALLACNIHGLPFCDPANHPFIIPSPRLTYRERRHLNVQLPEADLEAISQGEGIPQRDIKAYGKVYRYFPNFSEVDI